MNGFQEFRARHMAAGMRAMLPIEQEAAETARLTVALNDHVRCQGNHTAHPCSGNVTHRVIGCHMAGRVCAATAGRVQRRINTEGDAHCKRCDRPIRDCWRVVPWG